MVLVKLIFIVLLRLLVTRIGLMKLLLVVIGLLSLCVLLISLMLKLGSLKITCRMLFILLLAVWLEIPLLILFMHSFVPEFCVNLMMLLDDQELRSVLICRSHAPLCFGGSCLL